MFSERLKTSRMEAGLSQKALAKKLFVSQQAVGKWEVDQGSPNPEMIAKISEILNVSTDYLLGRSQEKNQPTPVSEGELNNLDDMERQLMSYVKRMTPEQKQMLLAQMQVMKERQKESLPASVR